MRKRTVSDRIPEVPIERRWRRITARNESKTGTEMSRLWRNRAETRDFCSADIFTASRFAPESVVCSRATHDLEIWRLERSSQDGFVHALTIIYCSRKISLVKLCVENLVSTVM